MKIWQNMELKYITYSEQLCKKLAKLGFTRKGKGTFLRRSNGFEQTLGYGHSARIPHTRDYYIMVGLECLELAKLGMDLGVYTAGVLDAFLDEKIKVDGIIGVSAGALFGVNYASKQKGRTIRYNKKYIKDKRYISVRSLIKTGNIVNISS